MTRLYFILLERDILEVFEILYVCKYYEISSFIIKEIFIYFFLYRYYVYILSFITKEETFSYYRSFILTGFSIKKKQEKKSTSLDVALKK